MVHFMYIYPKCRLFGSVLRYPSLPPPCPDLSSTIYQQRLMTRLSPTNRITEMKVYKIKKTLFCLILVDSTGVSPVTPNTALRPSRRLKEPVFLINVFLRYLWLFFSSLRTVNFGVSLNYTRTEEES